MSLLIVPYWVAALLLVAAGAPKVLDPGPTSMVARRIGLPSSRPVVRTFGLAEVAVGLGAILVGGAPYAWLIFASYVGFAAVVLRGLIRGDLESCGCFAGDDSPPSTLHVMVDGALAVVASVVAGGVAPSVVQVIDSVGARDASLVGLLAVVDAGLTYLVMTRLPRVARASATPARARRADSAPMESMERESVSA